MSIVLVGSTSGSITLQEPAVAGSTVLDLPATSGTILTTGSSGQSIPKAALPTGSVLQVVNATYNTQTSSSSSTYADTGLTASITPLYSSSKILVIASVNGIEKAGSNTQNAVAIKLVRNSTDLANTTRYIGYNNSTTGDGSASSVISYLDSPATTSSTTYKVQFASEANAATVYVQSTSSVSSITLMEIAA